MGIYREQLPQLNNEPFITDGGMETTLVFHRNLELPCFAAFTLLSSEQGREQLQDYFQPYLQLARQHQVGIILETATWRANRDWGKQLGYNTEQLHAVNHLAVQELLKIREQHATPKTPVVISGNIGPRGDGYVVQQKMTAQQACDYHREQIQTFAETQVDMVCAMTINYVEEAIGIARAATEFNLPVCISFTVETDGHLPSGDTLQAAIEEVDWETGFYPVYYMVNCAHPSHFQHVLHSEDAWVDRIYAVRANASRCSHAQLDEAETLDVGNPSELGEEYHHLSKLLKNLRIFGGCCGTDHRHIAAVCDSCL